MTNVEEMTPEEWAKVRPALEAATDPDLCSCGHDGLPKIWHSSGCPVDKASPIG